MHIRKKGDEWEAIKSTIALLVGTEDKFMPLSERALLLHLLDKGKDVAPHHIKQALKELGIPPTGERRKTIATDQSNETTKVDVL